MATAREGRGPKRLLLVFALSVLVPAVALAYLAYRSVNEEERALRAETRALFAEKRALQAERRGDLQRAAWRLRSELDRKLRELREAEDRRPYYQYNMYFFDPSAIGGRSGQVVYLQSPISQTPPDPLVEGYFNTTPDGRLTSPNYIAPCAPQGTENQDVQAQQGGRTRKALENAGRNLAPQIERLKEILPAEAKGRFPETTAENRQQRLTKRTRDANVMSRQKVEQILEGQFEEEIAAKDGEEEIDVVVSPFVFRTDPELGVLAFRYVDVPNDPGPKGRPFLRNMQGFTLDMDYLEGTLFPDLASRFLDGTRGRAALLGPGDETPAGTVVFEDSLTVLPSYRIVVMDEDEARAGEAIEEQVDEDRVARRVSRLSLVLLTVAGGLLLVILGGLAFTVRTVRAELALARRRSDFVAAVTHELRTPLTGIKMYADLLEAGWVKDEKTRSEYLGFVAAETDRLARLVNRVLDFSRTDRAGREVRPVDLSGPIEEVRRDFGPYLEERGFDLRVEIEERREVLADPDAVKQILLNLLENAAKYAADAEDRTVTLRVSGRGPTAVLSVADHGPGVPEAERDRIFEDFYRPGEELTREATGAGIGLALVRRLAKAMGGTAEVRETPGGGATFRVTLRCS